MSVNNLTPDSTVLKQVQEHWQKLFMFMLWKLAGTQKITLTAAEISSCMNQFAPGVPTLYTHGHAESIDFQVVTPEIAETIAAQAQSTRDHG